MDTILAKHQNGTTVYVDLTTKRITVHVPFEILYSNIRDEHFENNRSIYVSKCAFFHDYVGVGATKALAFTNLQDVLGRVFTRLVEDGSFLNYLEKEQKFELETFIPSINTAINTAINTDNYSVFVRTDVC